MNAVTIAFNQCSHSVVALLFLFVWLHFPSAHAGELSGYALFEARSFPNSTLLDDQRSTGYSTAAQLEYKAAWDNAHQGLVITPFLREDSEDAARSHFDLREAMWFGSTESFQIRLGISKVFWGVAESRHLVDIINQTDLVENFDGEDKLGQPMVNARFFRDWGTVDAFILPRFRERTFPGEAGRPRSAVPIKTDMVQYEAKEKDKHIDYAIRYQHYHGIFDFGFYYFQGTNREPELVLSQDSNANPIFIPFYQLIHQYGLDLQATYEAWLWKLEAIHRRGVDEPYTAFVAGTEYTFSDVVESGIDLGLLVEYLRDYTDGAVVSVFNDDVFLGSRFIFNDVQSSELLAGYIFDRENKSRIYSIEASRRIGNNWRFSIEGRFFSNIMSTSPLFEFRNEDYIQLELTYFF